MQFEPLTREERLADRDNLTRRMEIERKLPKDQVTYSLRYECAKCGELFTLKHGCMSRRVVVTGAAICPKCDSHAPISEPADA